ncbi:MAG TPA: WecB/TagA/CpsF family glycosyltransferase [Bryobacteraceae bacterium]|nr:WecB/TagA/CpsF family glycosyltransferase [Bryobacteraceae bacterium]
MSREAEKVTPKYVGPIPGAPVDYRYLLGMRVDATTYADAARRIVDRSSSDAGGYVCAASAHMVMEALDSENFRSAVNGAALVTADGMPLVWSLRMLGVRGASRVYGPRLMEEVLGAAERAQTPVGLYGGTPEVLAKLQDTCRGRFPLLRIAYAWAPPFRPLTPDEERKVIGDINRSGARILFVGIGCPKQEYWMARNQESLASVAIGVGAAFDFLAGVKKQAPPWMQRLGLEWLFRLMTEPRRLWRRYLKTVPRFALFMSYRLITGRDIARASSRPA